MFYHLDIPSYIEWVLRKTQKSLEHPSGGKRQFRVCVCVVCLDQSRNLVPFRITQESTLGMTIESPGAFFKPLVKILSNWMRLRSENTSIVSIRHFVIWDHGQWSPAMVPWYFTYVFTNSPSASASGLITSFDIAAIIRGVFRDNLTTHIKGWIIRIVAPSALPCRYHVGVVISDDSKCLLGHCLFFQVHVAAQHINQCPMRSRFEHVITAFVVEGIEAHIQTEWTAYSKYFLNKWWPF